MTDEDKAERLARVLWQGYWAGHPPGAFDDLPANGQGQWDAAAIAALTWLGSLEDDAHCVPLDHQETMRELYWATGAFAGQGHWTITELARHFEVPAARVADIVRDDEQAAHRVRAAAAEAERDALRAEVERLTEALVSERRIVAAAVFGGHAIPVSQYD